MIDRYWLWVVDCPCGYHSSRYFARWAAQVISFLHSFVCKNNIHHDYHRIGAVENGSAVRSYKKKK